MTNLAPIEGIDWVAGAATLRLEGGRVSGTGGINRLLGDYTFDGSSLTFGPLATTMMAGPPEAMEQERRFLADLAAVAQWSAEGDALVFRDSDHVALLRLTPVASA